MSNPKNKSPSKNIADKGVKVERDPRALGTPGVGKTSGYVGNALAKQEPDRKLTRSEQMDEVQARGEEAFAALAELLDGTPPLPLVQKAYYVIDKVWKKPLDLARKSINETLKEFMRSNVVKDEKTQEERVEPLKELMLDIGGETFKSERTVQRHSMGNAPDMADVRLLAEKLGLDDHLKLCNEVVSYEFNMQTAIALVKKAFPKVDAEKFIDDCRAQKSESLTIEKV